ncbi:MAG: hypothetical protein H0W90_08120 [Actinobacteria bacterium]|nr:hypothetical protein [Actinomycetota bacterium]
MRYYGIRVSDATPGSVTAVARVEDGKDLRFGVNVYPVTEDGDLCDGPIHTMQLFLLGPVEGQRELLVLETVAAAS